MDVLDLFRKIRFKLSKRIFSLNTSLLVTYEFKGEKILHISQFGKDGIRCEKKYQIEHLLDDNLQVTKQTLEMEKQIFQKPIVR